MPLLYLNFFYFEPFTFDFPLHSQRFPNAPLTLFQLYTIIPLANKECLVNDPVGNYEAEPAVMQISLSLRGWLNLIRLIGKERAISLMN